MKILNLFILIFMLSVTAAHARTSNMIVQDRNSAETAEVTNNALDVNSKGTAEDGVPSEGTDGEGVNLWVDGYGRQVIYGGNKSVGAMDVNPIAAAPVNNGCITMIDDTLATASGVLTGEVSTGAMRKLTLLVDTEEVKSADNSEWALTAQWSADGTDYITAEFDASFVGTGVPSITFDTTTTNTLVFQDSVTASRLKVTATCDADCDASDSHIIKVWCCYQK